jgi:hypothetical protein
MRDDFITVQIRRTNRNILLIGIAIIAVVGAAVGACWRDTYNFVFGPFRVQNAELLRVGNPDFSHRYFVKVRGEHLFDTGFKEADNNNSEHILAEFLALEVDNHLLVVKSPVNKHELDYSGTLVAMPDLLQTEILKGGKKKNPQFDGLVLPYMLDASASFRNQDNILAALGAAFFGGLGLLLFGISVWRRIHPDAHPLLKKLAQYGPAHDVRMRIDSELRSEGGGEKFGPLQLTTNWLIHAATYTTSVMAAPDVVWAYPKIVKHYHSGIPTGKTFSAIIRDSKGQSVEVSGKKDTIPLMLTALKRRLPSILIGYHQQLDHLWRKDRPQFLQLLQQQRRA